MKKDFHNMWKKSFIAMKNCFNNCWFQGSFFCNIESD